MWKLAKRLHQEEEGKIVEDGTLKALGAIIAIAVMGAIGAKLYSLAQTTGQKIDGAGTTTFN